MDRPKGSSCSRRMLSAFNIFIILSSLTYFSNSENISNKQKKRDPSVVIAVLARNKAHTLPFFLTLLEGLDYPKSRISLWIRSDHNEDRTLEVLRTWLESSQSSYHSTNIIMSDSPPVRHPDEKGLAHWTESRFKHVIQMREEALQYARNIWADYIWFMDCDTFLINNQTLRLLMSKELIIVAPMLKSDGMYANFWCGMTKDYYYQRTDEYKPILNRERKDCFEVPMVHSSVLIDLRHEISLDFSFIPDNIPNYNGPVDDIIVFALSVKNAGATLNVCNDEVYGFVMIPLEEQHDLLQDIDQLTNLKLEIMVENSPLPLSPLLEHFVPVKPKDSMGVDEVYMINLVRRPERRIRMENCFQELGLLATAIDAVDGRALNDSTLEAMGIEAMPEYMDPYHKRPLTMGEIGCFLSHYTIWYNMLDRGQEIVMVLEDDIRFEPYFRYKLQNLLEETRKLSLEWDLIYLGRKRLGDADEESWLSGSRQLVWAGYSYWTLGYLLSSSGAQKLVGGNPLPRLLPVDEYIPVMSDKHPEESWKAHFPNRDLKVLSAAPLLLYPTHYTGETGYVSDTEDSIIVPGEEGKGTALLDSSPGLLPAPSPSSTREDL